MTAEAGGLAALLTFLAVIGCGPSPDPETTVATRPRGAAPRLEEAVPQSPRDARDVRPVRVVRADTVAGPILGAVRGARGVGDGPVYLLNASTNELRRFEGRGDGFAWERVFGARGGGPGEFDRVSGFDVTRAGRLVVLDGSGSRLSVFDDTSLVGTLPLRSRPQRVAANDSVVFTMSAMWEDPVVGLRIAPGAATGTELFRTGGVWIDRIPDDAARLMGELDADPDGAVLVTMYSGRIIRIDNAGRVVYVRETLFPPDLEDLYFEADGGWHTTERVDILQNSDDEFIYVAGLDAETTEGSLYVDVYRIENGEYLHSFLPPGIEDDCGPRYFSGSVQVSICEDGDVVVYELAL